MIAVHACVVAVAVHPVVVVAVVESTIVSHIVAVWTIGIAVVRAAIATVRMEVSIGPEVAVRMVPTVWSVVGVVAGMITSAGRPVVWMNIRTAVIGSVVNAPVAANQAMVAIVTTVAAVGA